MNARQKHKLLMYVTVQTVLQANQKIWQALPAFGTAFTVLKNGIQRIKGARAVAAGVHTAREAMVLSAWKVATGLGGYASANNGAELLAKVDRPLVGMLSVRDAEAAAMCQEIHDAANAIVADLVGWGVYAGALTVLQAKIHAYNVALDESRPAPASHPAAKESLEARFATVDRVLAEQVDGLMEKFRVSEPAFYGAFGAARPSVVGASDRTDKAVHRPQSHSHPQPA